jgi:hypothetical protein
VGFGGAVAALVAAGALDWGAHATVAITTAVSMNQRPSRLHHLFTIAPPIDAP